MSSAGYVARAFLANLLFLPPQRLYQVFFDRDVGRNNQLQIGDCRFWGPEEFTAICQSAMDELRAADEKLFAELTSAGMITFWLKPPTLKRRVYDKVARFYSIDPVYYAWGAHGIIAFIIAIHFDEAYTPRFLGVAVETPSSRTPYRRAVVEWLTTRNYSAELVEPFHTNSPNQSLEPTAGRRDVHL
jgi:hypothetical protein